MLVEYCQCVDDTPMLVTDIMNKLFETLKVRFQIPPWKGVQQGWPSGVSAPFHQLARVRFQSGIICGLSLLLVFDLLRGCFSGFSGFPLSTKTNISKVQFNLRGPAWKPAKTDVTSGSHIIVFYYVCLIFFLFTLFLSVLCFTDVQLQNLSVGSWGRSSSACWIEDDHCETSRYLVVLVFFLLLTSKS